MRTIRALFMLTIMAISQAACAIPREDVLKCGLPDGSKFVLKSRYDWSPLAKAIPADVDERLNQHPFVAEFKPQGKNTSIRISGSFSHKNVEDKENAEQLCATFGSIGGNPYAGTTALILPATNSFYEPKFDQKLRLFDVRRENSENIRLGLEKLNAYPSFGAIALIGQRLVQEQSLVNEDMRIVSVFKSESLDMGETWKDPIITKDAEIFSLGKSLREQCFIARPISINGKKIQVQFPQCGN